MDRVRRDESEVSLRVRVKMLEARLAVMERFVEHVRSVYERTVGELPPVPEMRSEARARDDKRGENA